MLFLHQVLIALSALVASALAAPAGPPAYAPEPAYPDEPALYTYNFAVKDDYSNNNFGTEEKRDGYAAQGSYYVALPDGRLQKVAYSVNGDGGYVADVTYEGEAQYPEVKPYVPAPAYKPAKQMDKMIMEQDKVTQLQINWENMIFIHQRLHSVS